MELIIRHDKVYYFTRGKKAGLRNIGRDTAKISRNIDPNKLPGILANDCQSMEQRSKLPASVSAMPRQFAHRRPCLRLHGTRQVTKLAPCDHGDNNTYLLTLFTLKQLEN